MGWGLQDSSWEVISVFLTHTSFRNVFCQGMFCAGRMTKGSFAPEQGLNYLSMNHQRLSHYSESSHYQSHTQGLPLEFGVPFSCLLKTRSWWHLCWCEIPHACELIVELCAGVWEPGAGVISPCFTADADGCWSPCWCPCAQCIWLLISCHICSVTSA